MNEQAAIHLNTVKDFYSDNRDLFDVAVDAVVRGCVSEYYFNNVAQKFIGKVASLNGQETYEVEIAVTDRFEIGAYNCNCSERGICFHIGALALSSGYEEPTITFKCASNDDKSESDECASQPCATQPLQEVFVKCEELDQLDPHPSKDKWTGHEFLKLGNTHTKCSLSRSEKNALRQFKSFFGVSPTVCSIVWQKVKDDLPSGAQPKHLLWCLSFLKQYENEHKRRSLCKADEKTIRTWSWVFVKKLSELNVINWEKRFDGVDPEKNCFTSLDGVDFKIVEPKPLEPKRWFSHKLRSAGLRYEIGLNVESGDIVWAYGGYPCGVYSNLQLARKKYVKSVGAGEKTMAAKGYKDETYFITPNEENRTLHKLVMSRHESIKTRLKHFRILKDAYRHSLDKHQMVFHAVVNLTQLMLQNSQP